MSPTTPLAPRLARAAALLVLAAAPAAASDVLGTEYSPAWSAIPPVETLSVLHDGGLTDVQNGDNLVAAISALTPGQRLVVGAGTWSIGTLFSISLQGTPSAPIRIEGVPGAVVTRPNSGENVLNVGDPSSGPARYLALRGLEVTGGSVGIRLLDAEDVWIDGCSIHDTGGPGIAADTPGVDTRRLTLTRNEITATGGSGEGIRLGSATAPSIASECTVALNHVHHTGGNQGDGIELGEGSWGNLVAENHVHDTNYPGIFVHITGGQPSNVVERNVAYGSNDVVMQVEGEADVFNNLVMAGTFGAFYGGNLFSTSVNLRVENNTFITPGRAAVLQNVQDKPGMFFVNNACYSQNAESVKFTNGASGVTIAKNVTYGVVAGVGTVDPAKFLAGNGLTDFEEVSWDGALRNARPTPWSPLLEHGNPFLPPSHGLTEDLNGQVRDPLPEVGCYERNSWGCHYGSGVVGPTGLLPRISVNGPPYLDSPSFTTFVEDGPPNQLAVLLYGLVPIQVPLYDGHLWVLPLELLGATSGATGGAFLNLPIPNAPALEGVDLHLQWIVQSPTSPFGWAFTGGQQLTLAVN